MQQNVEEVQSTSAVIAPFNEADWMQRLLKLNPWVVDVDSAKPLNAYLIGGAITPLVRLPLLSIWHSESFKSARRRASISRWQEGQGAWVAWAEAMLALRRETEATGGLGIREAGMRHKPAVKEGALSRAWASMATADFSGFCFESVNSVNFRGHIFPHSVTFESARFGSPDRRSAVSFRDAKFLMDADFNKSICSSNLDLQGVSVGGALTLIGVDIDGRLSLINGQLEGSAWFEGAKIGRTAAFSRAVFGKFASFEGVAIGGDASFNRTIFNEDVSFNGAHFNSHASFIKARFIGEADFGVVSISDDEERYASGQVVHFFCPADFTQVHFDGPATFGNAIFGEAAIFRSAQSKIAFSLADVTFSKVPDFIEASFHEPPRLDHVKIELPVTWHPGGLAAKSESNIPIVRTFGEFARADDMNAHARLRKLRKMAADAKDHENELKFNGYEIASRRFWVDKPFGPGAGRFWWGWLYGLLSNYGQSLARPVVAWLLLFGLAAGCFPVFGGLSFAAPECHESYVEARAKPKIAPLPDTSVAFEAFTLSLRNATVLDKPEPTARTFGCLFGVAVKGEKMDKLEPVVPNVVTALSLLQRLLSAIFLFLAGLALRNMYRMK